MRMPRHEIKNLPVFAAHRTVRRIRIHLLARFCVSEMAPWDRNDALE